MLIFIRAVTYFILIISKHVNWLVDKAQSYLYMGSLTSYYDYYDKQVLNIKSITVVVRAKYDFEQNRY